ncbi:MAG: hypothetical protein ACRD3L_11890 [Terriglobales bacterium]
MIRSILAGREDLAPSAMRLTLALALALTTSLACAQSADDSGRDKSFDIRSSVGDMHVGTDVDQRELGMPAYPGARLRQHEADKNSANLALFTSAFGMKLLVVNYDSDDDSGKIVSFYKDKLKKYGRVLECHTSHHGGNVDVNEGGDDSSKSKELKCEGDNTGDVIELKVGTQDNQHVVAVRPAEKGKGSTIAMVYVHTRGKQGDI